MDETYPIKLSETIWTKEKPTFPWNITLSQFTCKTIQNQNEYLFITPNKTDITIAISSQKSDKNENYDYSYVFHLDTGPIEINLCEEQVIFFLIF